MKKSALILYFFAISFGLFAQEFQVPQYFKLENPEDYVLYDSSIIKCTDWIMETPANEQTSKRNFVNAFLIQCLTDNPNFNVKAHVKQKIVTFMSSPELFFVFMGNWAKYFIENKYNDDNVAGCLVGIESVIQFYTKNKEHIGKNKHVEKYIKMKEKGTLRAYIEKNA